MADYFGIYRPKRQKKTIVDELMTVPKKDSRVNTPSRDPRFIEPGFVHQADILFLPDDGGYKYALVVVDLGSGMCDAEPLRDKTQALTLKAFKTIYGRKYLDIPKALLQVDNGPEFKGSVAKFFSNNEVMIRRGLPGRHRQQATVEARNGLIARALFYHLHSLELKTKQTEREWVENLPKVVKIINEHVAERMKKIKSKPITMKDLNGRCEGESCKLLEKGQRVRVILDEPKETTGKKLPGKFRATDIRWNPTIRKIKAVILQPAQPPMYRITGLTNVLYTRNQLQLVE